jgi:hypothetical protein
MYKGLSNKLLNYFSNTIPLNRPAVNFDKIVHPN